MQKKTLSLNEARFIVWVYLVWFQLTMPTALNERFLLVWRLNLELQVGSLSRIGVVWFIERGLIVLVDIQAHLRLSIMLRALSCYRFRRKIAVDVVPSCKSNPLGTPKEDYKSNQGMLEWKVLYKLLYGMDPSNVHTEADYISCDL